MSFRLLAIAFLVTVCFAASCSSRAQFLPAVPHELTREQALAQLDALSAPADANPAQFEELRGAMRTYLLHSATAKWTSKAPTDAANKVPDLYLTRVDAATATAHWAYRNVGDYDQNSEVNIADLTVLGSNLGKSTSSPDWAKAKVADGDGNGVINISDLTPLGSHLLNVVDAYEISVASSPTANDWTQLTQTPLADATAASAGPRTFSVDIPAVAGQYFRVMPMQDGGYDVSLAGDPYFYDGTGGPPHVSDADYEAVLTAIKAKYDGGLTGETSEDQDTELRDFISSQPNIVFADASDGFVWGEFSDGRIVAIAKNRAPAAGQSQRYVPPAITFPGTTRSTSGLVPAANAVLYNSFTPNEPHYSPTAELTDMLNFNHYDTLKMSGTVDNYADLGAFPGASSVLYIDGHGGGYWDRNSTPHYVISTAEQKSPAGELEHFDDRFDGTLITIGVPLIDGTLDYRYGITDKFVVKHGWGFFPNALVFLNTCSSGSIAAAPMTNALLSAGATYVFGWDSSVADDRASGAAMGFFATTLGDNRYLDNSGSGGAHQRPFDFNYTLTAMHDKGTAKINVTPKYPPGETATLLQHTPQFGMDSGLLAPSIEFIALEEYPSDNPDEFASADWDVLDILGEFDPDLEPTVYIANSPLPKEQLLEQTRLSADWCRIKYLIPDKGPLHGDVVVEQNGLRSNNWALTEWEGDCHFSEDYQNDDWQGHLTYGATLHVHFRGAIEKYRWKPAVEPDWYTENTPGQLNGQMHLCSDSYADCVDGGDKMSHDYNWFNVQEQAWHQNTVTWSRTMDVGHVDYSTLTLAGTGLYMGGDRMIDLKGGVIHMTPWARFTCTYDHTETDPPQNGEDQTPVPQPLTLNELLVASGEAASQAWDGNYPTNGDEDFDITGGGPGVQTIDNGKEHWYRFWFWDGFSVNGKPAPDAPR